MSENMKCYMNVKNTAGGTLTLTNSSLPWGKWSTNPPTQIKTGTTAFFMAQGAKGSATGTQGSVSYMFSDNATSFTVSFDIPYSGANSGGLTLAGPGMSNYTAQETDSGYVNVVTFPSGGSAPTVYFGIGLPADLRAASGNIAKAVIAKVKALSEKVSEPTMDIAAVARAADCGEVSGAELIKMFNGKTSATARDIWAAGNIPPGDRVWFSSDRGLISTRNSFTAAVDFADNVIGVLKVDKVAYDLAVATIAALRKIGKGGTDQELDKLANELEDVKSVILAQRNRAPLLAQIQAIEAILACIYMEAGAALLQAGSCARKAVPAGTGEWQLKHLQAMHN
jgi:hypothetical protein